MPSKAAQYNKSGAPVKVAEEPMTPAKFMHDMALGHIMDVARRPLARHAFWHGSDMPESATADERAHMIDARQTYAAAHDAREWNAALALGERYGVNISEIPTRG